MWKHLSILIIGFIALASCKSEFETIRTSGDSAKMYEKANQLFEDGDYQKAIVLYELIIPAFRGKSEAEQLYFNYADAHYKNGSYILSAHYFKTFSDTYTVSPKREDALYLKALSHYRLSPKSKLDQTESKNAIEAFQFYANSYPNSEKVDQCNTYIDELRRKMEEKEFAAGELYYRTRNYSSAIQALENMLKEYPESKQIEEARYLITKASFDLAKNSIYTKQEERFKEVVEHCDNYLRKHPDDTHKDDVLNFKEASIKELETIKNG